MSRKMSAGQWAIAGFGFFVGFAVIVIIGYDIVAYTYDYTMVSVWCLQEGSKYPIVVALLTISIMFPLGVLVGHLWFPQDKSLILKSVSYKGGKYGQSTS